MKEATGGVQALVDELLKHYGCIGIYTPARQMVDKCLICKKVNRQAIRKQKGGGKPPALRPFQCIQVDFTIHVVPV